MKVLPIWRKTAAVGVLALPIVLSGCSYFSAGPSSNIDAPPAEAEQQMLNGEIPTAGQVAHDPASLTTVYLENQQGLLAPVSLPLGEADNTSTQTELNTEETGAAAGTDISTVEEEAAEKTDTDVDADADTNTDAAAVEKSAADTKVDSKADAKADTKADAKANAAAETAADPAAGTASDPAADQAAVSDKDNAAAEASAAVSNEILIKELETLVKDGPYQSELPTGFTGVLPAGTKVNAVTVNQDQKTAVVEFSKEFSGYDAQDERKILEAVTWTMTEQNGINNVEVWVDGQRLNQMPVAQTPVPAPLNRSVGINLELSGGSVSHTTPVTVYFTATSEDGDPYYVPVTRFVPSEQDPLKAALGQLIQGPMQGDGLEQVLTETASVKSVEAASDGVIHVALNDDMFESGEKLPSQMLEAVVLTLTENAKGSKVSITFNDSSDVVSSTDKTYSDPVTRPEKINDLSI